MKMPNYWLHQWSNNSQIKLASYVNSSEQEIEFQRLPYGFAKRFNIVIENKGSSVSAFYNENTPNSAMLECLRICPQISKFEEVSADDFNLQLARIYQETADSREALRHLKNAQLYDHELTAFFKRYQNRDAHWLRYWLAASRLCRNQILRKSDSLKMVALPYAQLAGKQMCAYQQCHLAMASVS